MWPTRRSCRRPLSTITSPPGKPWSKRSCGPGSGSCASMSGRSSRRCRPAPRRWSASTRRSRRTCGTRSISPTTRPPPSATPGRSRTTSGSGIRLRRPSTARSGTRSCTTPRRRACCARNWSQWPPGCWSSARSTGRPNGGTRGDVPPWTPWCGRRNRWCATGSRPAPGALGQHRELSASTGKLKRGVAPSYG